MLFCPPWKANIKEDPSGSCNHTVCCETSKSEHAAPSNMRWSESSWTLGGHFLNAPPDMFHLRHPPATPVTKWCLWIMATGTKRKMMMRMTLTMTMTMTITMMMMMMMMMTTTRLIPKTTWFIRVFSLVASSGLCSMNKGWTREHLERFWHGVFTMNSLGAWVPRAEVVEIAGGLGFSKAICFQGSRKKELSGPRCK